MGSRSTNAQFNERVMEVHALLLKGYTRTHVLQQCAKWNVSDRQIDDYIKAAKDIIIETNLSTMEENQALISNALWKEYRSADQPKDKISALKELARIHGLGAQKLDVSVTEKREFAALSEEELKALLEQSKARSRSN